MKRIPKFLYLPIADRRLLVKSAFLLVAIRLGLWLLPFQTLQRFLARITPRPTELQESDQADVARVVWAVTVASRYIPGVRCLAQALAAQVLLTQGSYPTCLRIGIAMGKGEQLFAHAWLESQQRVAIGGSRNMARYILLPLQEEENSDRSRWHLFS